MMCNVTQIRYYRDGDLYELRRRDSVTELSSEMQEILLRASTGFTFTILNYGRPAAIIGGYQWWKGCACVWAVMSDEIRTRGLYLTKVSKILLEKIAERLAIHRYQAIIDSESSENIRWIITLGFRYEATLKKASTNKTDIHIYSYLVGDHHVRRPIHASRLRSTVDQLLELAF